MRHWKSKGPVVFIALLLMVAASTSARDIFEQARPSPPFDGLAIPEPPAQHLPWTEPPSSLPKSFVSAASKLFEQGMADPRGCEYHEITVGCGNVWSGDSGLNETRGWLLPSDHSPQRFAVCWNGLVYPVVTVGKAADWKGDARTAMKNTEHRFGTQPEGTTIYWKSCQPIKGCLLLRLGEAELAKELWTALQQANHREDLEWWERRDEKNRGPKPQFVFDEKDPYHAWVADWSWSLFDRAICAHMRGDDALALLSARKLDSVKPVIEKECEQRGIKRPDRDNPSPEPYFEYFVTNTQLLKDQERRAKSPKRQPALEFIKGDKIPQAERVAALIGDLEKVAVRQWSQPGGLGVISKDPIVAALIKEGEPVIEPLLQLLASDAASHLTRSVTFGRDFSDDRCLHTVLMPAREALLKVMQTTDEAVGITPNDIARGKLTAKDQAERLRAYWQRFGSVTAVERWYQTLADDAAGKKPWHDAIKHIVAQDKAAIAGEPLRAKAKPSVSELLAKRAEELIRDHKDWGSSMQDFHNLDIVAFIKDAIQWEAAPMLPAAQHLMKSIVDIYGSNPEKGFPWQFDAQNLAQLTIIRMKLGDEAAIKEWAEWFGHRKFGEVSSASETTFAPLWRYAERAEIKRLSHDLFARKDSPWNPSVGLDPRGISLLDRNTMLALLVLPEIRQLWLRYLDDTNEMGESTIDKDRYRTIKVKGGTSGWGPVPDAPVGAKAKVLMKDLAALQLTQIKGFPQYSEFWPEAQRNTAIAAMKEWLSTKAHKLRAVPTESHFVPILQVE